jgi:hypothetical protein
LIIVYDYIAVHGVDLKINVLEFDNSNTSTNTSCKNLLAINCAGFGPKLTPQEGSYHHSLMKEQHLPDTHPNINF